MSVALWGDPPLPRLVHLSDRIQRLLEQVDAENADHVLLTGDLTALGDDEELREIRGLLQPLIAARRLTVIPGNHDRYTDAPSARGFERTFSQQLSSDLPEYAASNGYPFVHLVGDRLALVGLDSTRVGGWSHYFFGALGSAQLDGLERLLADPRLHGRTVLVLSHHGPLGPAGTFDWRESGLRDGARLLGILEHPPPCPSGMNRLSSLVFQSQVNESAQIVGAGSGDVRFARMPSELIGEMAKGSDRLTSLYRVCCGRLRLSRHLKRQEASTPSRRITGPPEELSLVNLHAHQGERGWSRSRRSAEVLDVKQNLFRATA